MTISVILLSIPGLRSQDLAAMPQLTALMEGGDRAAVTPSFPCVTWPVQANMLTGQRPAEHGVVANGFYWRDEPDPKDRRVEMWTAWNQRILKPQIWDRLHAADPQLTSAAWFPMLSKGCGADYICMPAPVHNPDGSESLWCYTRPTELYGQLRDSMGHFPLQHFWGPLANIKSTSWIADSALFAAKQFKPRFFYIYLPHLDYAAQKLGPDSPAATQAVADLDTVIGKLANGFNDTYGTENVLCMAVSEYVITAVDHVTFPNRVLRDAGLLRVRDEQGEQLDLESSLAWALVDHQFSHVFVKDRDPANIAKVVGLFQGHTGIEEVLSGVERRPFHLDHPRSGDVILISSPNSWQAYYWWNDDQRAPKFARTVDIHAKPGYDPVELHFDFATKSIPLDASLIKGSHGAPVKSESQRGVCLSSRAGTISKPSIADTDIAGIVLRQFAITD